MVAAAHGEEARPPLACREMELQRHLHRDLDRDRARVGEEDVLERFGREVDESTTQLDGRAVREPAEHHMAHLGELERAAASSCGTAYPWMAHHHDDMASITS